MERVKGEIIRDKRRSASGLPLIFLIILAAGSLIFAWRGIVNATLDFQLGNVSTSITTLVAATVWLLAATGALHNGRRMRRISGGGWFVNVVCAVIGGIKPELFDRVNPWFEAGSTYFYLPTVGAILALAWLIWSRPAHHALRNG